MYFLDTCAMIEYVKDNPRFVDIIRSHKFHTSIFQLMELYYITLIEENQELAEKYFESFSLVKVTIEEKTLKNAMKVRLNFQNQKKKVSYVDALGYQYAIENNLKFVTSDPGFDKLDSVEFIPEMEM
ncbi:PIN domain-containing protein [Candidatus Micrarchaeota archaeon]|nr:PIN domain-containing protein [Candidatus Micrarchaeota archaeon]